MSSALITIAILFLIGFLFVVFTSIVENIEIIKDIVSAIIVYVIRKLVSFCKYIYELIYDIQTAYFKFRHYRKTKRIRYLRRSK